MSRPLAVTIDSTALSATARAALTTDVSLFHTLPGAPTVLYDVTIGVDQGQEKQDSAVLLKPRPDQPRLGSWVKRKNRALRIATEQ